MSWRFQLLAAPSVAAAKWPDCALLHSGELDLVEPPRVIQWGARVFLCEGMRLGAAVYYEAESVHRLPVSASNPPSLAGGGA